MRLDNLSEIQLDALREIGGIGAGHAATALSQLVDRPIALEVPRIEVVEMRDIAHLMGGPERLVGAVYCRMLGDIEGGVLFMAGRHAVLALVDLMHGRDVGKAKSLGHEEEALLRHVASILISAYFAAIARMADLDILPSSPALAFDMAGAIIESAVSEVGLVAEHALLVTTAFVDQDQVVEAALFLVPHPEAIEVLLGRLGLLSL